MEVMPRFIFPWALLLLALLPWTLWVGARMRSVSYTHLDAADDLLCVDLGGRRNFKKKNKKVTAN